jgi:hypothetical protein
MIAGLDIKQVRQHIVRPTLEAIGLWSETAENLVLGTAVTESGLRYVKQLGKGPALGICQMEPFTHNDIWRTTLLGKQLGARVGNLVRPFGGGTPSPTEMIGNLNYAVAMCRAHYWRIRAPLPENEPEALAKYWKRYYNTELGKGRWETAAEHFARAIEA